ncbi:MAG TPA: glycosyltransferase, partial [candidate division Zixibacteria bacterium]|nr:glycosyltransferase [candidate division Zixibacteria bacterium]
SHDTFGLGHFRRCLKIAKVFRSVYPESSILIVTGQPQAERYRLPDGVDFLNLPAVVKTGENQYRPRSLGNSFEQIFEVRQNFIFEATRSFAPHLFLVDHSPLGMKGEAKKTLFWLKEQGKPTAIVLGLRDILDEPKKVCETWKKEEIYPVLENLYDRIFIYGTPEVFDAVSAYSFGEKARAKTHFTGFITEGKVAGDGANRRAGDPKQILVTIGGGEDGAEIVETYLQMLSTYGTHIRVETTIITGPFLPDEKRAFFAWKADGLPVRLEEFVPELSPRLQMADLVVTMGGYNTVTEILAVAKKALIIPRIYPRTEQLIRAQKLSRMGLVNYISPQELTVERLYETVTAMLHTKEEPLVEARRKKLLPLDGAFKLAEFCRLLLAAQRVLK